MKTVRLVLATLFILICMTSVLRTAPTDTGFIQWTQPNGTTTFTARYWGDEFFSWFETQSGYRLIQASDGWYYYAALDSTGEYTPTTTRVGIDTPPGSSYKLERSAARIAAIKQRIAEAKTQTDQAAQWWCTEAS